MTNDDGTEVAYRDHRIPGVEAAVHAVERMIDHSAPRTVLNVNVPNLNVDQLRGARSGQPAPRGLMGLRLTRSDDRRRSDRGKPADGMTETRDAGPTGDICLTKSHSIRAFPE